MGYPKKATDEQIVESYNRTHSVWKTGQELGMCGQSVHERLQALGLNNSINVFTKEDNEYLAERYVPYRNIGQLQALADEMGRTKPFICRQAKRLGLTDPKAPRNYSKLWKDMPREQAQAYWDDFKRSRWTITEYCKRKHYGNQIFCDCMRRNFPEEYETVIASKKPRVTQYSRGRDFEYRVLKDMNKRGYLSLRSPASKSPADIYCMAKGSLIFVQCKLTGVLGVQEWNEFLDYCEAVGATPVMAENDCGSIKYHLITKKKDNSRRKQPMVDYEPPIIKEN